MFVLYY